MFTRDQLREDQKAAIDWLRYRTEAFVLLGVGFGKTIVTLTALRDINEVLELHGQKPYRALVVSTKNIVDHTWPDEIRDWEHVRHFSYASAAGRSHAALEAWPDILGINFESLEWFLDCVDVEPGLLPDVLVIDESSKMKSHTAKRVKRLSGIGGRARRLDDARPPRGYVHRFKRRFALSATPAPEGYAGLWSQEACISLARRLGRNISEFRRRYCHSHWNGFAHTYTVSKDGERAIEEALAPITYTPAGEKYLDLPDPIQSEIMVPWTKEAREQYDAIEDDAFTLLEEGGACVLEDADLDDPEQASSAFDVASVAARINKLRQACSGFVYDDQGLARWLADPGAKLRALEAVCERAAESPVLVFTQYIAEAEAIGRHFRRAVVGLPRSLDNWNAGRIPMLVLHPKSAGHGLNLQHGSHVCVFYSLPWGYEDFYQGYGRLHRGGQTKQVSVLRLMRPDSVEEDVWGKIMAKERKLEQFIGSMRSRRQGRAA